MGAPVVVNQQVLVNGHRLLDANSSRHAILRALGPPDELGCYSEPGWLGLGERWLYRRYRLQVYFDGKPSYAVGPIDWGRKHNLCLPILIEETRDLGYRYRDCRTHCERALKR